LTGLKGAKPVKYFLASGQTQKKKNEATNITRTKQKNRTTKIRRFLSLLSFSVSIHLVRKERIMILLSSPFRCPCSSSLLVKGYARHDTTPMGN
jgi:hypothetical protein